MENNQKYFNFPVQLLDGFLIDSRKVLDNIFDYAVYNHSLSLEYGAEQKRFVDSLSYFNVTSGNHDKSIKNGKLLLNSIPENSPKVGLSTTMFFDFYKNYKTEFEKATFLAFLAFRSIVGQKAVCKVTNDYLLSRMDGKPQILRHGAGTYEIALSDKVRQFANDYQLTKIKKTLRIEWNCNFNCYGRYTRGFYFSFTLSMEQLIEYVEKKRKSNIEQIYKQQEKDAIEKALLKIGVKRP